jgi:NAD-dependent DNA ligase
MNLSPDEISISEHFQKQRGGNCLSEFKKLEPVLERFISQKIDAAYIFNYLGKPNKIKTNNKETQYQYYLTEKLDGSSVSLICNNYHFISYKLENSNNPLNSVTK